MATTNTFIKYNDHHIPIIEHLAVYHRLIKQKAVTIQLQLINSDDFTLQNLQGIVEETFNAWIDEINYYMTQRYMLENIKLYNHQPRTLIKKDIIYQVMNFAQIILYKTLPCPKGNLCPNKPREIAPSNQYKDEELACPFYHHEKDRRRLPITSRVEEEFIYKANYDKSKCDPFPNRFSRNYFESMYHPIYYKLFQCKRIHCEHSCFCPFFHDKNEKMIWDQTFLTFIRKSRDVYTKEKKERSTVSSLQYIPSELIKKYQQIAKDNELAPFANFESQSTMDRISTNSSSKSPSSNKDLSPQNANYTFENWLLQESPNHLKGLPNSYFCNEQQNQMLQRRYTTYSQKEFKGESVSLPDISNRLSDTSFKKVFSAGGISLFGEYSNIFCDSIIPQAGEDKEPNVKNSNQFFNWEALDDFNNLRLN